MRIRRKRNKLTVHAISGTHVVTLAMDAERPITKKLLGFAIRRTDHTEDEEYWLKGFKVFEETDPGLPPGSLVPTYEHPVQTFLWSDYTAKPKHDYTYEVVPVYGKPKNLELRKGVKVKVSTEGEKEYTHAVYFNRGVAASQAYARKFQNKKPKKVPDRKAFEWLSRGLEEAMLAFIRRARTSDYALRGAFYEFNYQPVLTAFREAADAGADVKIIYDARKKSPREENDRAITKARIRELMIKRTRPKSYIAHNKFMVLLKGGKPREVWTGSTNVTESGIFGQLNVGHVVRDKSVAETYYAYWQELAKDPTNRELRKWVEANTPDPVGEPASGTITPLFSPRKTLAALEWYADRIDHASQTINLTLAFTIDQLFVEVFKRDRAYLRYLIFERKGKNFGLETPDKDVRIAVGAKLEGDYLYRWTKEKLTGYSVWVSYIHTKFLLIDTLSDDPIVISGSANFSKNSTTKNDENMLLIRGDTRVADIYLGEFMRLFNHFYFRNVANRQAADRASEDKKSAYLKDDESWVKPWYKRGTERYKRRRLFQGK
jgi:phosphatidylserine/phosphatidylglycerophosphate/cardiolipin synthase-like enzyme